MQMEHASSSPASESPSLLEGRIAGYALIVLAMLTVLFMAMHPTAGTHDPAEFVANAGRGVPGNAVVHGVLLAVILLMSTCFLWFRDVLGPRRMIVRAGLVAMVVGTAGAVAAALVNGFIVPSLAAKFSDASPAQISALTPVLAFAGATNATCARLSVVGLSLSTVAWAIALLGCPGWRRIVGIFGIACGLVPLGLHAAEHLHMDVAGYGLFVRIHAAWSIAAGVVLVRTRRDA